MTRILLSSMKLVDPFHLDETPLTIPELIHPLCLLNRYTGQTIAPYSVAEHTYHLMSVVPEKLKRAAALHDLNEGLTNDIPRPLKARLPEFCMFEEQVQRQIFRWFGEPWDNMEALADYDNRICVDEMSQIFERPYERFGEPVGITVRFWSWDVAKERLTAAFKEIGLQ